MNLHAFIRGRFGLTLLLAAAALPAAAYFRPVPADPLKAGRYEENLYYIHRTHRTDTFDIAFVGDSRIQRGIDPQSVAGRLPGLHTVNLGYSNGSVDNEMLDFAVQHMDPAGARILVLGISSITFTQLTEGNAQLRQYLGAARDEVWMARYAPQLALFFQPVELVTVARALARRPYLPPAFYHQTFHDTGWMESDLKPRDEHRTDQGYRDSLSSSPYLPAREAETIERITRLTAAGYRVFALRVPIAKNLQSIESQYSRFDWQAFRQRLALAGGTWLEIPGAPWTCYDGSHLAADEARRYSAAVGQTIAGYLSLGRNP